MLLERLIRVNYFYFSLITVNLLALIVGQTLTWTSATIPKLQTATTKEENPLEKTVNDFEEKWQISLLSISAIFGCCIFAYTVHNFGYKPIMPIISAILTLSYVILGFSKSIQLCLVGRTVAGLSVGGFFATVPIYLEEISEISKRGAIISSLFLFLALGSLIGHLGSYFNVFKWSLWTAFLASILTVILCFATSESPEYLVKNRRELQAKRVLIRLRNTTMVDDEFRVMFDKVRCYDSIGYPWNLFTHSNNLKTLLLSTALIVYNQISGINILVLNLHNILGDFHQIATVSITLSQLLGSFLATVLVERAGRKFLLLFSTVGVAVCQIFLCVYLYISQTRPEILNKDSFEFAILICIVLFSLFYSLGLGCIPWIVSAEIFRPDVKGLAGCALSCCYFLLHFLVIQCFFGENLVVILVVIGLFASLNILGVLGIALYLPETKSKCWKDFCNI